VSTGAAAPRPPSLRLFFALWPAAPEQLRMAQASAASVADSGGRAIPAGNLHVTLAFLGNVEPERLEQLRAVAQGITATPGRSAAVLPLQFKTLEHWVRPQILCATADAATAGVRDASALAAAIRQAALAGGFAPDLKPFRAHVTVARKVTGAAQEQPMPCVRWNCTAFALVASSTSAAGSLYSVLESYPLDRAEYARK
jgi:RNA 2',3'-cyclic 3'-phosphodiesterase